MKDPKQTPQDNITEYDELDYKSESEIPEHLANEYL